MKKIKTKIKKFFQSSYFLRNLFNKLQVWKQKQYYKKYCIPLPIDENLIVFESFLGKQYACSPKAIYEAIKNDPQYANYCFAWMFQSVNPNRMMLGDERTVIVRYGSKKYYRMYARAKYWVSNGELPEAIVKKDGQIYIQTWQGTPLKKMGMDLEMEENITKSQKARHKKCLSAAMKYDYFISPSRFGTDIFKRALGLSVLGKEDIIIEEGSPRNDFLYQYNDDEVMQIKKMLGISEKKKVILYAPAQRDNQNPLGAKGTSGPFDYMKEFVDSLSDEYVVLVRLRDLFVNSLSLAGYEEKVKDCSKMDDVNKLYVISDVLITDYSNVIFDYSNLKRPILFYMHDLDEYENSGRDFYVDLKELPGPIAKTANELLEKLKNIESVSEQYKESYKAFREKYTYLDDENAGLRVVKRCIRCVNELSI